MKKNAYKEAGVDIEAGAEVVERIAPHVKATMRPGVMSGLGGFGAFFDPKETGYEDPLLISGTDGVGTKIKIAIETGRHDTVGVDVVAMCVNDILAQGAEPLYFLDYFASGKLEPHVAEEVIAGVAAGCVQAGCALIGGETAEMPGIYAGGDYDLAGFTVGAVERSRVITGERVQDGDILLGLASDGVHSNGFSLVRRLVETTQGAGYDMKAPFASERTLGDILLTPTRIYVKPVLAALRENDDDGLPLIRGMAHITGGGLEENVPRLLPDGLSVTLDADAWEFPPVFRWLAGAGNLGAEDLAQTFNCGIGFVIACRPDDAAALENSLRESGETVYRIGHVAAKGDGPAFVLNNAETAWRTES